MLFEEERKQIQDPLIETWGKIQLLTKKEKHWVKQALGRAKKQCSDLLEPEPSPIKFLGLRDFAELQLFYTFLLERFVRTDKKLKTKEQWAYVGKVIDPVRSEIIKNLTVPASMAKDWIRKLDSAAQFIVLEWRKNEPLGDRYYSVAQISERFKQELNELREAPDELPH